MKNLTREISGKVRSPIFEQIRSQINGTIYNQIYDHIVYILWEQNTETNTKIWCHIKDSINEKPD